MEPQARKEPELELTIEPGTTNNSEISIELDPDADLSKKD
jgi:hypothetical protein